MNLKDLSGIGAGFCEPARGSQAAFRAAMHALSHPGRLVDVAQDAEVPSQGHAASAVLLLALLDTESRLWLSPSLVGSNAAAWLRFHTGCVSVDETMQAQFAWAAHPDELPALHTFAQGTDAYPEQSATCVIDVPALVGSETDAGSGTAGAVAGHGWTLRGPGIREQTRLRVAGLPQGFAARFPIEWAANHAAFPRGVDLFLAAPRHITGLPRTTRIDFHNLVS